MSENDVRPNGGWSFHTLFLFFDQRIEDMEKQNTLAFEAQAAAADKAVELAKQTAIDAKELAATVPTKSELALQLESMGRRVEDNEKRTEANERAVAAARIQGVVLSVVATGIFGMLVYLIVQHFGGGG